MKKQLLLFVMMLLPIVASADKSGTCGDNLTWTLVESTGTLTISGSGAMNNYATYYSIAPWYDDRAKILAVVIEDGVTSIGEDAFYNCSSLNSITIPNSVTTIGEMAFYGCSNLESIDIPESTKTIGDRCFEGCTNLKVLEIPGSVTSIGDYFFDDLSLEMLVVNWPSPLPTTIYINKSNGHEPILIVPIGCKSAYETDDNWNQFTEIIDDTFVAKTVEGARIRYKITDEEAKRCETCSYNYIPAISMNYQGRLEIPKEVGEYVVTGIGDYSFKNCDGITEVCFPNTIETIGELAFSQCDNLERVTAEFNYVLRNIGSYAFNSCPKLTDFGPTGQLQTIGDFAFAFTNISEFVMPVNIRQLGHAPFAGCTNLTRFFMNPNPYYDSRDGCKAIIETSTNTLIEYLACSNSIPSSVKVIGSYAMCGDYFTSFTIPEGVECISEYGFYNCKKLENVILPKTLKKIETAAFIYCSGLTSITIPNNVTSLGAAFWSCHNLTTVTVYAPSCSLETNPFMYCTSLEKIYVFNDKMSWYTTNWSDYADIIKAITLTANEGAMGEYWATYYNNLSHTKAPSGTQVFKVALTGSSLELTEITDGIITMGEGVVLKSNTATIKPEYSGTESVINYNDNDLEGTMTSITNPGNAYVLNKKEAGVGFYKLSATGTIGANKAYLTYDGSVGACRFFGFGDTTSIKMPTVKGNDTDAAVYDLQGRCVAQPTKGLYIVNGKKVIIK